MADKELTAASIAGERTTSPITEAPWVRALIARRGLISIKEP
jgi:hypothetical protein